MKRNYAVERILDYLPSLKPDVRCLPAPEQQFCEPSKAIHVLRCSQSCLLDDEALVAAS